jgi:hypothetical protein
MALSALEVLRVEERLGVKLPPAYAAFLREPDLQPWARLGRLHLAADRIIASTLEVRSDAADGVLPVATVPPDTIAIGGDRATELVLLDCRRALVHVVDVHERTAYLDAELALDWESFRREERATPFWMHLSRWNDARSARATYVVTRARDPHASALDPIDEVTLRAIVAEDPDLELTEREHREDRDTCEAVVRRAPGRIVLRAAGAEWDLDFRHGRLSFWSGPVQAVEEKMREVARRLGAAFVAI